MILVRDHNHTYVGTMKKSDFLRFAGLTTMPPAFKPRTRFIWFYDTELFSFYSMPQTKAKASLELKSVNGRYLIHEKLCIGCEHCEGQRYKNLRFTARL